MLVLLILLCSCAGQDQVGIDDLCPGPIISTQGVHSVVGVLCGHTWKEGDPEKEFCEWVQDVDLQQEELKVFHEYRSMMEDTQ